MYRKILLAYDGSTEGRRALREGAVMAFRCNAEVYLLAVLSPAAAGKGKAEGAALDKHRAILDEGAERLERLGFTAQKRIVIGEPMVEIAREAKSFGAELVVVGHRKRSMLERWWGGSTGAALSDNIGCSILVSVNDIPDAVFTAELQKPRA